MTWAPVHTFNIACGTAGAFVDVSADILTDQGGLTRSWGRQSAFSDFSGGTFAFTLDNRDGRYTPDNTATGATPLSEGMYVTWATTDGTNSRLISGKIAVGGGIGLVFTDPGLPASARLRITVSDMLVEAGRHTPSYPLAGANVMGSHPYLYWPLNDPAGSVQAIEQSGNGGPPLVALTGPVPTFGVAGNQFIGSDTQMSLASATGVSPVFGSTAALKAVTFPAGSLGFMGIQAEFTDGSETWTAQGGPGLSIFAASGSVFFEFNGTSGVPLDINYTPTLGTSYVLAVGVTWTLAAGTYTFTMTGYVNGASIGTASGTNTGLPTIGTRQLSLSATSTAADTTTFAHWWFGPTLVHEEYAGITSPANRLAAIDATTPEITLASLPANISTAALGIADTSGQSVLDMLNDVARTTQGQLFCTTTGTGTAPVQTIGYRDRDRPATATATWVLGNDITGTPDFERDLSNTVSEVDVTSPAGTPIVTGADLALKVGSANTSFAVLSAYILDATAAGSDRLNRGRKNAIDLVSFTVDNFGLATSRAADLFALALGDRHTVGMNTANTQLGYTSRDGFLSGVTELWSSVSGAFTLYLENSPVKATATYNGTARYAAGGTMSIGTVNATATSFTVTSTDPLSLLGTADLPYTMQVDAEQVTVTAVSGSSSPQTATVTRGANGSTAAAHSAGALIDVFPLSYYGY